MDKKGYVRIMIEAPGCEAKALAVGYKSAQIADCNGRTAFFPEWKDLR